MKRRISYLAAVSLLASLTSIPSAFAATTYSFTSAGATGQNGPTQAQVTTAYTGTNLAGSVTVSTQGIQTWTVPVSGSYQINAVGAGGGGAAGGNGASMSGTFTLTSGTVLKIVVGQTGVTVISGSSRFGGGGGSYVTNSSNSPYVVAGGGGGSAITGSGFSSPNATDGSTVANPGTTNGGLSGSGSSGCGGQGQGGGGLTGNGTGVPTAMSFTNASVGGGSGTDQCPSSIGGTPYGGFGGGGAGGNGGGAGGGYYGGTGGDNTAINSQYDPGDGGGSYNSGTNQTNTVASNRGTNGSVTITLLGPSLTTFSPTTTITNSSSISYNIVFSQAVTGLAANDFSLSGTGSSTCVIGSPSGSGTTYAISLSSCSQGTVILTMAANAVQNSDPQYAPSSSTAAATVTIDQTAPTISSVTAPNSKTYIPSETATFTVNFSESVTVTGTPRLTLTVGSSTEYATYLSMSDSKTALFRYTVATDPAEFDTDGIAVATTLDLNSGIIRDLATNALTLTFSAPTLTGVLVAQPAAAPTIDSITATNATLTVYFTAGATRGSTTSNYQYSANNGAWTTRASGTTASPLAITGLTNGTGYTIRIRAVTNAGNSDSSTAVTETPTAVAVTGDATLVITYGNSGTTGNYSATGGTGVYTWSLGSSISGITLSGTAVTASSTLSAGTYSQSVRATDGNSQVGSKTLTITVNKASTSISIALPNSASSAALGGAVTITATVPRAGAVDFKLGGTTISGCGSAAAASTSATCSWTPGALGSVSLTAVFTPTDSSNYETSTTTTLTITVVNGVSTVTLSLTGGVTQVPKGKVINIIAAVDQAGKISFLIDGKRIPGCTNKSAAVGNVTCSWKPAVQKQVTITAYLNPTSNVYNNTTSTLAVIVTRRTGTRG